VVSDQLHAPATLLPREIVPGTHWVGGWVCSRAVLDAVDGKFYFPVILKMSDIDCLISCFVFRLKTRVASRSLPLLKRFLQSLNLLHSLK
jgi:hypothetical protein